MKIYRKGAIGALMDEYERAAAEIKSIIERTSEEIYEKVFDEKTVDEACRSIQTIISHVVLASYGYANLIRGVFGIEAELLERRMLLKQEAIRQLEEAMKYTAETLEGKWQMSDEQIEATVIQSGWGVTYNLEQILEHAIVHVLRHRRQIEKFLATEFAD